MQLNYDYEIEQSNLKDELSELENRLIEIDHLKEIKDFLNIFRKHTDNKELEYDAVRELTEMVMLHGHLTDCE